MRVTKESEARVRGPVAQSSPAASMNLPRLRQASGLGLALLALLVFKPAPAMAFSQVLNASMSGSQEVPLRTTSGGGTCSVTVDVATGNVAFSGTFGGLSARATAAALHGLAGSGGVAPVMLSQTSITPAMSGTFSGGGVLTAPQVGGLLSGRTYCEIADVAFPAGEVRGQLMVPALMPALPPSGVALLAATLGAGGWLALRKRARRAEAAGSGRAPIEVESIDHAQRASREA